MVMAAPNIVCGAAKAAFVIVAVAVYALAMDTTAQAGEITTLWETTFEPEDELEGRIYDLAIARDGGYCIVGAVADRIAEQWDRKADVWALRLDPTGDVIWDRTFDRGEDERGSETVTTENRGCVVGASLGQILADVWMFAVNGRGDIVWQQTFGGRDHDTLEGIAAADAGFAVLGSSLPYPDHPGVRIPYWIARVSADGVRWQVSPENSALVHQPPEDDDRDAFLGELLIADLENGHTLISGPFAIAGSDFGYGAVEVANNGVIARSVQMGGRGWPHAFTASPEFGHAVAWIELAADAPRVVLTRFDPEGREL